jgi:HSP20 family protein
MKTTVENEAAQARARKNDDGNWLLPPVNVYELQEAYVIEAEMPGVARDGLEVTLEDHTLTLAGRRGLNAPPGAALHVESKPAGFRRVFEVDPAIDAGKISARLEQGLLTVHLPKAERLQPRRITVND